MAFASPATARNIREEVAPDDLTAIRGIGAGMQRHLNKIGIYTYAQLAASTP